MIARTEARDQRSRGAPVAVNLELSHGRHGAAARLELHDRGDRRIAVLAIAGWVDTIALARLDGTLRGLEGSGASRLLLDCSQLRHIDYRLVPQLVDALARFESRGGGFVVCGLSRYLRDLFRMAGCEPRVRCWPSTRELLDAAAESSGERAS